MEFPYRTARILLLRLLVAAILFLTASIGPGPSAAAAAPPTASAPFASAEEEWEEEPGEWEIEDDEEEWEVEEDNGEWEVEIEVEEEGELGSGWEVSDERQHRDAHESCTPYRANAGIVASERRNAVRLKEMSKVRAAKAFAADLDMAKPSYCEQRHKRHLTRRQRGGRVVRSEPAR